MVVESAYTSARKKWGKLLCDDAYMKRMQIAPNDGIRRRGGIHTKHSCRWRQFTGPRVVMCVAQSLLGARANCFNIFLQLVPRNFARFESSIERRDSLGI